MEEHEAYHYKQVAYKLQGEIENRIEEDLLFIKEIIEHLELGEKDITHKEMGMQMLSDWRDSLYQKLNS